MQSEVLDDAEHLDAVGIDRCKQEINVMIVTSSKILSNFKG